MRNGQVTAWRYVWPKMTDNFTFSAQHMSVKKQPDSDMKLRNRITHLDGFNSQVRSADCLGKGEATLQRCRLSPGRRSLRLLQHNRAGCQRARRPSASLAERGSHSLATHFITTRVLPLMSPRVIQFSLHKYFFYFAKSRFEF